MSIEKLTPEKAAIYLASMAKEAKAAHMVVRIHPRGDEDEGDLCTVVTIVGQPELSRRVRELLDSWDAETDKIDAALVEDAKGDSP